MTPFFTALYARLIARPLWALAVLVLVTLGAGWQALSMRVAVDLSGLIGADSAGGQAIRDYGARFAPFRAEEVLLVRAPEAGATLASDAALAALEDLVFEVQFLPGVERVISLPGIPAPGRQGAWLSGPELAGLAPAARLETMRAEDPLAAQILSADLSATVMVVIPAAGVPIGELVAELEALVAQPHPLELHLVGLGAVQRAIGAELIHDLGVLTPSAVALCLILSALLFRSVGAVVVIAAPPLVGLVWFLGWMGLTDTGIDPVMGSLPVLLIVLAFSDSIHMHHAALHALADLRDPAERPAALARAAAQTLPAAVLTSVTTVIAFASLLLPASPSLNTMAGAGAAGMALCLIAVLVLTPVLMVLTGVPRIGAPPPRLFSAIVAPAAVEWW